MVMENYVVFAPWANFVIAHVLSLGAAAMAAGLIYFLVTAKQVSPRYRVANYLGAVVMVSAFLELANQYFEWTSAFRAVEGAGGALLFARIGDSAFSNGYRYVNWSIDVPVLLTQVVVVLGLTGKKFWSPVIQFTIAGLAMIYTGYVGQYYEAVSGNGLQTLAASGIPLTAGATFGDIGQTSPYWIWFAVSCVFYAWILLLVVKVGLSRDNLAALPPKGRWWMKAVVYTLIGSWMLYLLGYLMPAVSVGQESGVIRQIAYTVADIVSKVLYGVMIGYVAMLRSNHEGYNEDYLDRSGYRDPSFVDAGNGRHEPAGAGERVD